MGACCESSTRKDEEFRKQFQKPIQLELPYSENYCPQSPQIEANRTMNDDSEIISHSA